MDQGVVQTFKAYYSMRSFAHLNGAMRQNNEFSVKDLWKQLNILAATRIIVHLEIKFHKRTLNGVWKKLLPFFFTTET